jgi:hypothetical protein
MNIWNLANEEARLSVYLNLIDGLKSSVECEMLLSLSAIELVED